MNAEVWTGDTERDVYVFERDAVLLHGGERRAGMRNFLVDYRQRVDFWQLYDNSGPPPRLVEEGANE